MSAPVLPSASAVERVEACPASHVLPQVREELGEPGKRGVSLHAFIQLASEYDRDKALAVMAEQHPEHVPACELLDLDALPIELDHEVAFAFDVATGKGRRLGTNIGRNYSQFDITPTEYVGSADLCGLSPTAVLVGDYKSGHGEVTPAVSNLQVGLLGLAAARTFDREVADVWIVSVKNESRPWFDRASLDEFDLGDVESKLIALPGRIKVARAQLEERGAPDVREGNHCRYCPAFNACPAKKNLALRFADGALENELDALLTPEKAAQALARIAPARQFLSRIEKAVYSMAKKEPIDLGDGTMLGEVTKQGNEKLNGRTVFDVVKDLHGSEVAEKSVELSATKKKLKEALRPVAAKRKLAAEVDSVLDEVRTRGGAERPWKTTVAVYPKKELTE